MEKKLPPITDALIAELKTKHDKLFSYKAADGRALILRSPTIPEMDAASSLAATKPLSSNRVLAKACALAGDESIIEDPAAFVGLSKKLSGIIKAVEGELSEL
jgi:hypothetical protein